MILIPLEKYNQWRIDRNMENVSNVLETNNKELLAEKSYSDNVKVNKTSSEDVIPKKIKGKDIKVENRKKINVRCLEKGNAKSKNRNMVKRLKKEIEMNHARVIQSTIRGKWIQL